MNWVAPPPSAMKPHKCMCGCMDDKPAVVNEEGNPVEDMSLCEIPPPAPEDCPPEDCEEEKE